MDEPSVLDYVKARLKFWEKPSPTLMSELEDSEMSPGLSEIDDAVVVERVRPVALKIALPWLTWLPLGLALLGQSLLEPPDRIVNFAVLLYVLTALVTILAVWRGDLALPQAGEEALDTSLWRFHLTEWFVGLPIAAGAFALMAGNRFTIVNAGLWLLSLALFLYALLDHDALPKPLAWLRTRYATLRAGGWTVRVTGFTLAVLAVLGLSLFFRFHRLDEIPIDMVSDHAEKLLDVYDVTHGKPYIFFERNTGREPFQFYWTVLTMWVFNLPISFFALKLGTVLTGLIALYYSYKLGDLLGGRWVALAALLLVGVAYWANVISRISLRFPLYPMFVAPLMYHLIRALRLRLRNEFIWAGVWLGIGLNGYTSSRIVPLLVMVALGLYLAHRQSKGARLQAMLGVMLVAFFALVICIPIFRYMTEHPEMVLYRSMTRLGDLERPLPGPALQIFLHNSWRALTMFFYDNGSTWPHSVPGRPALDVVMAALYFVGSVMTLARYVRQRNWEDLFLLVSVPILLLPSILSLAFPDENPSLNRTAGTYVPVFILAAMALVGIVRSTMAKIDGRTGVRVGVALALLLGIWTTSNNNDLFFHQYADNYRASASNTREIGMAAREFAELAGTWDNVWLIGFPYWADSRQVAIFAGHIERDIGIMPEIIPQTVDGDPRMKLYIVKPEDTAALATLQSLYPQGVVNLHKSDQDGKDFILFFVPGQSVSAVQTP